ncbi:MAG: hypothetical protein ACLSAH_23925 [Bilophila wadsworthia]
MLALLVWGCLCGAPFRASRCRRAVIIMPCSTYFRPPRVSVDTTQHLSQVHPRHHPVHIPFQRAGAQALWFRARDI